MDSGLYIDFPKEEKQNTFWTLQRDSHGNVFWGKKTLNHIVAGDTDSGYFKMPESIAGNLTIDDAVEIADTVTSMINDSYVDFAKMAFNAPEERGKRLNSDREVVARKGLFLTKKRYVLDIVDDEGERKEKRKIVGAEIIKSDTSEAVKRLLTEIVDMILDDRSMQEVLDHVDEMKDDFCSLSAFEVATPCGVNSLGKLNQKYKETGSVKDAHYAALAAFAWNEMRTSEDKEIYPGEKVGVVYVKGFKYKYIAFPIDETSLPDWFNQIALDHDRMWQNAKKKITNYLMSMGWDNKSRKDQKRESLFGF